MAQSLKASFEYRKFEFKRPSGTSRGILTEKHAWFISIWDENNPEVIGVGECSIIPGLSPDYENHEQYEKILTQVCENVDSYAKTLDLHNFPSVLFGLETALLDLKNEGKRKYFDTPFYHGKSKIPINGLIWMGTEEFMRQQIEEKLEAGFDCIKMKIGAIDFENEIKILKSLRNRYSTETIEIRVDANGAFSPSEALEKLKILSELGIHSIEQPIRQGQIVAMQNLCASTPLDIALDEELIGVIGIEDKRNLLETIQPQYIILKPSLHGGISGTTEWINLAEELNIKWWMTSALESNIGLEAIAQFASTFNNPLPQGLGTGALYTNNAESNLKVEDGEIFNNF